MKNNFVYHFHYFFLYRIRYLFCPKKIRLRFSFQDYLYYHMQDLRKKEIDTFLTPTELNEIEKKLNQDSFRPIFQSKKKFYETFQKYISRDIIFPRDCSYQEFVSFVDRHNIIIIKPDDLYAGIGIYVLTLNSEKMFSIKAGSPFENDGLTNRPSLSSTETLEKVFAFCCDNSYIMEEYVFQAESYASIAPKSLNTIRITTLIREDNTVDILFAVNQFGFHESVVDNDDHCSIWGLIDPETGILTKVDEDEQTGMVFQYHPDTDKPLIGFQNPDFDKVKELAVTLAKVVPQCRLIGWDIAVKKDGKLEVIEGNVTPELDLYQAISRKGIACDIYETKRDSVTES